MNYKDFIGHHYPNENGILLTIFSQPFPLNSDDDDLNKSFIQDRYGTRSDVDADYLRGMFEELYGDRAKVVLKNQRTKDDIKTYIQDLGTGDPKETDRYDTFIFAFLTYLSEGRASKPVFRDERIHLYDGLCSMQEFYDEVKKTPGMQLKPKIFLVQADDISLLFPVQHIKGEDMVKPIKIPQDADRLVIMSDIPQRFANQDLKAEQKNPSFMINAFGEALRENSSKAPGEKQDLLLLTQTVNNKVSTRIEKLKETVDRATDMNFPLTTTTLTKFVNI